MSNHAWYAKAARPLFAQIASCVEFVDPVEDLETACNVGTGRYGIGIRREKVNLLVHVNAREG